ncbi:MAG: Gfo/Idh/MocA family oxidoreductase [Patescibacteria group bacterium]|jgi:hypothetical protein
MKIGLIGYGSIGERHHRNLTLLKHEIVVLTKRRDVKGVDAESNWRAFAARGPYDVPVVANETFKHVPTLSACLTLKPRAVFVEKPLSQSAQTAAVIARAYKRAGVSLWVGYNLHFFLPLLRIKKMLTSKKLGKIYAMRVSVGQDLRTWRVRDYRKGYASSKKAGGGVLLDLIHDINYPAWLLDEPLHAKAAIVKKISRLEISSEDFAESLLISKSGVIVSLHQDYVRIPVRRSLEIIAEKGSLMWNSETDELTTSMGGGKQKTEHLPVDRNLMYVDEMRAFFTRVQSKKMFSNTDEAVRDLVEIERIRRCS